MYFFNKLNFITLFYFSENGAHVTFLQNNELQERFPFMNFEGIVSGTCGKFCF